MTVSDFIACYLADLGLKHIFLLPGGGAMHLNDAFAREPRISVVTCQHEQACAIAAESYGRTGALDNPGFGTALVTTGPGATNAITPVAGSWIDSIPLLIISGQVKTKDSLSGRSLRQGGVQEVDILSMVRGVTKYAASINCPESVRLHMDCAINHLKFGRPGPVWLEVPLDIQGSPLDLSSLEPSKFHALPIIHESLNLSVDRIITLLNSSNSPLILAGHGVRLSGASSIFSKLIDSIKVPVVTTWNALDLLPHDHPFYVGSPGVVALRPPNFAVQNCDLLLSIGCRLDNILTAYAPEKFAHNAQVISVDIDTNELSKNSVVIDLPVCSDALSFIELFLQKIRNNTFDFSDWSSKCSMWKSKYPVDLSTLCDSNTSCISHYAFVDVLSDALSANLLIATGSSGLAIEVFYSTFRTKKGQRIFLTSGLGSMGYGLPSAIGACCGSDYQKTLALESDGSIMLNIQELATIVGYQLPIKIIIMDNGGYASIKNTQKNYFSSRFLSVDRESGLYIPDLQGICESFGLACSTTSDFSLLKDDLSKFISSSGPSVLIVKLLSDEILQPKVSSIPNPNGSMTSMPLEDMSPLLDISVLESEMNFPLNPESYTARNLSIPNH